MERYHHITGNGKIDGALSLHSTAHAFNEIQDYLKGLVWDGTPRLDTLFVDYLGALIRHTPGRDPQGFHRRRDPCHAAGHQV